MILENFSELLLPEHMSYFATGGPCFSTDIATSIAGFEQRNVNWLSPRSKYNLAPAINSQQELNELINFFRIHKGRAIGFRFKDINDYTADNEFIAVADGLSQEFQLIKNYSYQNFHDIKLIKKPVLSTITVLVDDKATTFTCNINGKITLSSPPNKGSVIKASFEFHLPMRFDTDYLPTSFSPLQTLDIPIIEIKP
jgi:uncharacterized protein (TIGR02217 family)